MNTEQNAEWLKKQRQLMINAINKVVEVVTTENLKPHYKPHYNLGFETGMSGKHICLLVWNNKTKQFAENMNYYCMDMILEEGLFHLDIERITERVDAFLVEVERMKEVAKKYAKLNEQSNEKRP